MEHTEAQARQNTTAADSVAVTAMKHAIGNAIAKPTPYVSALIECVSKAYKDKAWFESNVKPGIIACYEGERIRNNAKAYKGYINALTEASGYTVNPTLSKMLAESATKPAKSDMFDMACLINGKARVESENGKDPKGKIELRSSELSRSMLESISAYAKKATFEAEDPSAELNNLTQKETAVDASVAAIADAMSKTREALELKAKATQTDPTVNTEEATQAANNVQAEQAKADETKRAYAAAAEKTKEALEAKKKALEASAAVGRA